MLKLPDMGIFHHRLTNRPIPTRPAGIFRRVLKRFFRKKKALETLVLGTKLYRGE